MKLKLPMLIISILSVAVLTVGATSVEAIYLIGDKNRDNVFVVNGYAGEPKVNRRNTRPDPYNEIKNGTFFPGQPFHQHIRAFMGDGADLVDLQVFISGKGRIIERNANDNGVINWNGDGVAGENNLKHDHWVDKYGRMTIYFFNPNVDRVSVTGHTVERGPVRHRNGNTHVTVISQQGDQGADDGAHDMDRLGKIIFVGVEMNEAQVDAVMQFNHTNDGIVDTVAQFKDLVELYDKYADCKKDRRSRRKFRGCQRRVLHQIRGFLSEIRGPMGVVR